MRIILTVTLFFALAGALYASEYATVNEILSWVQGVQNQIIDMRADLRTEITSNDDKLQKIVQTGKYLRKGSDVFRIDITNPKKQTTIFDKDNVYIIDPFSGRASKEVLTPMQAITRPGADVMRYFKYFNLKVTREKDGKYLLLGTPKDDTFSISKLNFYIDQVLYVPVRIAVYDKNNSLLMLSSMEYKMIGNIPVMKNNSTIIKIPSGILNIENAYDNIVINRGIPDTEFTPPSKI
ncbi:MAG: outer-membrane lipoprotein carrier protein LolA [bacterium]